ncbi:MAG: fumarylacetoacetate hydrolase family protein [Tannerella sp.]|jgi:2-keto-4-pentenoate hydratase/2-oxohepta-3-ene-1,7-dioic acid hydratase in catechol pathway|nr:fumarylacetoacetate hydrolase family protein [Tannerella sp.]
MKIICVGMNYASHNKEMRFALESADPVLFLKADSALLKDGKPFFLPDFSEDLEYETELVVRIDRLGRNIAERFACRYFNEVSVGIDFTARDLQARLRSQGLPWEISKAFDNSAALGSFLPLAALGGEVQALDFRLDINGKTVQNGRTAEMIASVDRIVAYASRFFTLRTGDLLYTGTPEGVGRVHIDDHLEGYLCGRKVLEFNVK